MLSKNNFRRFIFGPERGGLGKVNTSYLNGIRIITVGGVVALSGAALVAFGVDSVGISVLATGITIGVIGFIFHVIMVFVALLKNWNESK